MEIRYMDKKGAFSKQGGPLVVPLRTDDKKTKEKDTFLLNVEEVHHEGGTKRTG